MWLKGLNYFIIFVIFHKASSKPLFISTLIGPATTTTTPSTHISDFRGQPRAAADEVTTHKKFELSSEATPTTAQSYPRQYVELISNLIGTVRERFTNILQQQQRLQDHHDQQLLIRKTEVGEQSIKMKNDKSIIDGSSQPNQNIAEKEYIDFRYLRRLMDEHLAALMTSTGAGDEKVVKAIDPLARKRVFPKIYTNLRNLRKNGEYIVTHALSPNQDDRDRLRVMALYTFAPVLGTVRTISRDIRMNRQQGIRLIPFFAAPTSQDSPPFLLITRLFPINENVRMQRKLAFQNAFIKYASLVLNNTNDNASSSSISNSLIDDMNFDFDDDADDNIDDNDSNIETFNEDNDKINDAVTHVPEGSNNNTMETNAKAKEAIGILLLEFFGQLAGLTWGAFSQLPVIFNGYRNNGGA